MEVEPELRRWDEASPIVMPRTLDNPGMAGWMCMMLRLFGTLNRRFPPRSRATQSFAIEVLHHQQEKEEE